MCNVHSHGHAHGVRTDAEKAMADLRDDLVEELKLINKFEAQIPVIAAEDFPEVDEVVHTLSEIRDQHKAMTARLFGLLQKMDASQAVQADHHHHDA